MTIRFLADESCDFSIVRALRIAGYDVLAVVEHSPRAEDVDVIERAVREKRILVTEDKDFGQLVYASQQKTGGVILIRYPTDARSMIAVAVTDAVRRLGRKIVGRFVVIQPHRIRVGM